MRPQSWLCLGEIHVDLVSGWIVDDEDKKTKLTTKEVDLLRALVACPGGWLEREHLYEKVWGYSPKVVSRSLDTTLFRLRAKLGVGGGLVLHTARSRGVSYRPMGAPQDCGVSLEELGWEYGWDALPAMPRLLSIIGPACSRRTQLAWEYLQWRRQALDARWLTLAGVGDVASVEEQVAAVLGEPQPWNSGAVARSLGTLREEESVLLVLDDIDACHGMMVACLSQWLAEFPQLQVAVTTHRPLAIGGEHHLVQSAVPHEARKPAGESLLVWARRCGTPFSMEDAEQEFGMDVQPPLAEQVLSLLDSGDLRVVATEAGERRFLLTGGNST